MPYLAQHLIQIPALPHLPQPTTDKDRDECRLLGETIGRMNVTDATLTKFDRKPGARIHYEGGLAPAPFWNKWLWVKIGPESQDFPWLARLVGMVPKSRELYFVPRPDRIDESMAEQANAHSPDHRIIYVTLGIVYPPHQCRRTFYFSH